MNDEQFEGTMYALELNGYGKQVAKLRLRDTTQREVLEKAISMLSQVIESRELEREAYGLHCRIEDFINKAF